MKFEFKIGKPFKPFEQLMGVLPEASKSHIPLAFRVRSHLNSSLFRCRSNISGLPSFCRISWTIPIRPSSTFILWSLKPT